ncbi:CBS domain-containing protein, partial [Streptomyces sp. NPDC002758]
MAQRVRDIMSDDLVTVEPQASVAAVARLMRDQDVGAVLVTEDGRLRGLVSDRDLVVCAFAEGTDPERTTVARACRGNLITIPVLGRGRPASAGWGMPSLDLRCGATQRRSA